MQHAGFGNLTHEFWKKSRATCDYKDYKVEEVKGKGVATKNTHTHRRIQDEPRKNLQVFSSIQFRKKNPLKNDTGDDLSMKGSCGGVSGRSLAKENKSPQKKGLIKDVLHRGLTKGLAKRKSARSQSGRFIKEFSQKSLTKILSNGSREGGLAKGLEKDLAKRCHGKRGLMMGFRKGSRKRRSQPRKANRSVLKVGGEWVSSGVL